MRQNIQIAEYLTRLTGMAFLILVTFSVCLSQESEEEPFNWTSDSILTQRIDTLGLEFVRSELRRSFEKAIAFCADENAQIPEDSVTSWVEYTRWAAILMDNESLDLLDALTESLRSGDRGQWQYYISYMTLWGVYEGKTQDFTIDQKLDMIFPGMFARIKIQSGFYEDRMIDLGSEGIPHIVEWVKSNLIPEMDELDKEMLSEEDYQFTRKYNRFVMVFSNIIISNKDKAQIQKLKNDQNPKIKRFANDVLKLVEF